ncbi:MAG: T9SS type A sorting domain-containing protein [Flavobacterium sp.]|uniref:T9SS type A sorting domain-containing protein n=1 Tax=Flavobacterium sp. TaxID=239 RepID=UPI0032657B44
MKNLYIYTILISLLFTISYGQKINSVGETSNFSIVSGTQKLDCLNNNGVSITTTGSIGGEMYQFPTTRTFCLPNARYIGNVGLWTDIFPDGFVTYTFNLPLTSARITYSAVNGPDANGFGTDIGQININGGGVLTLANSCGAAIAGDVLTCNLGGPTLNNYGDVSVTVSSTCPFTSITLFNIGGESGWVQGNPCNFILTPYNCSIVPPILSDILLNNICPNTTVNLNSITASNLPSCNTVLSWHSGPIANSGNIIVNPNSVGAGTYYASFYNSSINCYSATTLVTVVIVPCCLPTLTLSNPVNNVSNISFPITIKHREASNWIRATNIVNFGDNVFQNGVVYHADNFVELNPGFEADLGSQFSAYIEGCSSGFVYKNGSDGSSEEESIVLEDEKQIDLIKNKINIYPNPTNSYFKVSYSNEKFNNVKITSLEGRVMFNQKTQATNSFQLDVSNFKSGIYTVSIETLDGTVITDKLIKK